MYNACAFAITGKEDLSPVLRALTSLEMYLYTDFYASHPHFMCLLSNEQASNLSELMFFRSLSFDASDGFSKTDRNYSQCVKQEALNNCENGRWSPFICIMALSSVIELPITSLFPDTQDKSAVALCNGTLFPRKTILGKTPIHFLWSVCSVPIDGIKSIRPNHIVPVFILKHTTHVKNQKFSQAKLSFESAKPKLDRESNKESVLITNYQSECFASNTNTDFEEIFDFDVGSFYLIADKMSDSQKYNAIENVWKPDAKFSFPSQSFFGKNRRFLLNWLFKFPWLAYSKKLDGAFCLPCVLFGKCIGPYGSKLTRLVKSPFSDWSCASRVFNDHQCKSDVHKTSILSMQNFCLVMEDKIKPVNKMHDVAFDRTVSLNREKLNSIVKTVILCGRQNIPLRGHRDDSSHYDTRDCGNFQALLNFRVESGDKVLEDHFKKAPKNATYRSKTTQNEIIECCSEVICEQIIADVRSSKYFSILADEVTDCSTKEQMPLVLRYVDRNREIQERFVKFIHCDSGISGNALKDKVLNCLTKELQLDINNCRGQCYDGASNMAGQYSGLAARICQINPLALYTHCASHRLNLCVAAACQIQSVRNMMSSVTKVGTFFNTPKRQLLLAKMIRKFIPTSSHTKLIDVCQTRWVLRIDGLDRFLEMYIPIFEALSVMKDNLDGSWNCSSSDAYSHFILLQNFSFLMTLVIVKHCLGYTKSATVQLQGAHLDILTAIKEVDMMLTSVNSVRKFLDVYHNNWFREACNIAGRIDSTIKHPRICEKQSQRSNNPAKDTEDYFKLNISIPFLDHLLQEVTHRFSNKNCIAIRGLSIIPSIMAREYQSTSKLPKGMSAISCNDVSSKTKSRKIVSTPYTDFIDASNGNVTALSSGDTQGVEIQRVDKEWKENFREFCNQYSMDLPCLSTITYEVDNWESLWKDKPIALLPSNVSDTLKQTNPVAFPNIFTALTILAVLPVTSCTCERSASSVRLIKTYLRSTMSQSRLNGLASLYTQKDIPVDVNSVINKFSVKHKRRMMLKNILQSDDSLQRSDDIVQSELY